MSKENRKQTFLVIGLFFLSLAILGGAYLFFRAPSRSFPNFIKVGVVNGDKIGSELPPIKHLKETLNHRLREHQKKFSLQETQLRKENQEILELQHALIPGNKSQKNILEQKQKDFSFKVMKLQKEAEESQKSLNDLYEKSMSAIKEKINQSIEKISKRHGLSMVLYSHQAAHYDHSLDITDDVFKDLKEFKFPMLKE